ncbi:uncharacterized protein C8R40DRAFT_351274 [Lentinula edodes]|uniref:uncharacterized protein n=1 Tax=Lentinula edodes TaxID=5353 RepID=UPI001E8E3799|nr:uncharacterized protein C8R40DRAFT_351274 [Lentinula edodes]KAH7874102.1 hypothetical protein C8R40DRAFT_351274 [Lentinula edodes]
MLVLRKSIGTLHLPRIYHLLSGRNNFRIISTTDRPTDLVNEFLTMASCCRPAVFDQTSDFILSLSRLIIFASRQASLRSIGDIRIIKSL